MADSIQSPSSSPLEGGSPALDSTLFGLGGDDTDGTRVEGDNDWGGDFAEPTSEKEDEETDEPNDGADAPGEGQKEPDKGEPSEITIGDKKFTPEQLEELISKGTDYTKKTQELAAERETFKTDLEAGKSYLSALKVFDSNPQGAAQVIDQFIMAARQRYGDAVFEHMVSGLDFDNLSDEGRALNNQLRTRTAQLQQLQSQNQELQRKLSDADKALGELKPVIENAKMTEALDNAVIAIKRDLKADVTTTVLRKMIADTGENDPVKAFKLSTYDEIGRKGYEKGYRAKTTTPEMPDAQQGNLIDTDNMSADEILRMMNKGYVPMGSNKLGKPRQTAKK